MPSKMLIHIGAPKCGSTYLQNLLRNNEATLAENRWRLPALHETHPGTDLSILKNFKKDIAPLAENGESVIISHEDLISLSKNAEKLIEFGRENFQSLSVIAFVRPIEEIIFGSYSQHMKQFFEKYWETKDPYGGDFDHFIDVELKKPAMSLMLKRWQEAVGESNLEIYPHTRILEVLTAETSAPLDPKVPSDKSNISLRVCDCDEAAEKLRSQNLTWDEAVALRARMFKNSGQKDKDTGRTPTRKQKIRDAFHQEILKIDQMFGVKI